MEDQQVEEDQEAGKDQPAEQDDLEAEEDQEAKTMEEDALVQGADPAPQEDIKIITPNFDYMLQTLMKSAERETLKICS